MALLSQSAVGSARPPRGRIDTACPLRAAIVGDDHLRVVLGNGQIPACLAVAEGQQELIGVAASELETVRQARLTGQFLALSLARAADHRLHLGVGVGGKGVILW